jgi:hypothetical protein
MALLAVGCTRTPQQTEARFLKRGLELYSRREYARAALEFKNAAAAVPGDSEAYL